MSDKETFRLTEDHIKLLRRSCPKMYGDGLSFGTIMIDSKRPFGNGDIVSDMASILGVKPIETDDGEHWPPGTTERMQDLFDELGAALSVILATGSFEPGMYETPAYKREWSRVQ